MTSMRSTSAAMITERYRINYRAGIPRRKTARTAEENYLDAERVRRITWVSVSQAKGSKPRSTDRSPSVGDDSTKG
jgi:hypothetical protein